MEKGKMKWESSEKLIKEFSGICQDIGELENNIEKLLMEKTLFSLFSPLINPLLFKFMDNVIEYINFLFAWNEENQ